MKYLYLFFALFLVSSCGEDTAHEIVDKSMVASGSNYIEGKRISFYFRDYYYESFRKDGQYELIRRKTDTTGTVKDVLSNNGFQRYINEKPVSLPDSMAVKYSESVNSVHYFAYLPYGLNDASVHKELLGEVTLFGRDYYKIKIWFDEEGGGEDYEDIYVYWIDKQTFTIGYLAYLFHVDGGGLRFRDAYNERTIKGIRFADYRNFKPKNPNASLYSLDSLFIEDELELLSTIELKNIKVDWLAKPILINVQNLAVNRFTG